MKVDKQSVMRLFQLVAMGKLTPEEAIDAMNTWEDEEREHARIALTELLVFVVPIGLALLFLLGLTR